MGRNFRIRDQFDPMIGWALDWESEWKRLVEDVGIFARQLLNFWKRWLGQRLYCALRQQVFQ